MLIAVVRVVILLSCGLSPATPAAIEELAQYNGAMLRDLTPVDARPLPACLDNSVPGARCLPVADFHSPAYGLASFHDIAWALGTAGLNGSRRLLVFADSPDDRDAIAALLYLAGQAEVWRWPGTVADLQRLLGHGSGTARATLRLDYYGGPMRDHLLVLSDERDALIAGGWREWHADRPAPASQGSAPILLTGGDIQQALSTFARLLGEGEVDVRIMVDPPAARQTPTTHSRTLTAILLLVASLLLFIVAWRTSSRKK